MFETFCTVGLTAPAELITERTCDSLAVWFRLAVIRVPEVKSIPRFRPLPPMASAPTRRITPDIEKKNLEAPMKSNRQARRFPPAPSAEGLEIRRDEPMLVRIACVASTAVNSDTNVPIPKVNANPWTPAVASTNRMNAVMIVTTLASMIAVSPFR